MPAPRNFDRDFEALTGHAPFPWQRALFDRFQVDRFPDSCNIPTGLGKTSIIVIWLLALAHRSIDDKVGDFPRRLVYVVNRRVVVDQSTWEAERVRERLATEPERLEPVLRALGKLAAFTPQSGPNLGASDIFGISSLRGQLADNAEWQHDPARPAVVIGTVDMIGSRLLFSGYGRGFKSRPLHAGFLGQDVLLVHDEAHLEPAFQALLEEIAREQKRCEEFRRFRVVALTATLRNGAVGRHASAADNGGRVFTISDADRQHEVGGRRINATKAIGFHRVPDDQQIVSGVVDCARQYKDSGQAILVFLRAVKDVETVSNKLGRGGLTVGTLTGTMRGLERDRLVAHDPATGDGTETGESQRLFTRFMPHLRRGGSRAEALEAKEGTVYLVCTSAGEVGVDISADHMICDLTPLDSMIQRLGRVNRFGDHDARVDVFHEPPGSTEPKPGEKGDVRIDKARWRTLSLLHTLPKLADERHEASPAKLSDLRPEQPGLFFSPTPQILPVNDILFDAWALTSVRKGSNGQERLPGWRPVAGWLHGLAEWEPSETHVAWREEVELIAPDLIDRYPPRDLLDDYPLKPHELLRDRTDRVFGHLEKLAARHADALVWVVDHDHSVEPLRLWAVVSNGKESLEGKTILLPPKLRGLAPSGVLDGSDRKDAHAGGYDVADEWFEPAGEGQPRQRRRCRRRRAEREGTGAGDEETRGMRLVRSIDLRPSADETENEPSDEAAEESAPRRYWDWYVRPRSADDDGSQSALEQQVLDDHLSAAGKFAGLLASKLGLEEPEATAVEWAARWHDAGKDRSVWQRSIGNVGYPDTVLAKSGGSMRTSDLGHYRHELGSVIDVSNSSKFTELLDDELNDDTRDLLLHLIAAHHGRARPHFPDHEAFDPERPADECARTVAEVPRRFARLQKKYGRWGLAYLESLVRAADVLASQPANGDTTHGDTDGGTRSPFGEPR